LPCRYSYYCPALIFCQANLVTLCIPNMLLLKKMSQEMLFQIDYLIHSKKPHSASKHAFLYQ
jgi:hypothetical protein